MDSSVDYARNHEKYSSFRQFQEKNSLDRLDELYKLPYKPTTKKSVGEYYPTIDQRLDVVRNLAENEKFPLHDREFLKKYLNIIHSYEKKGLLIGMLHGYYMFFGPGIRRLSVVKRSAVGLIFCFLWTRWGYNYGRDVCWIKSRNIIENWERDVGLRHFQTGL